MIRPELPDPHITIEEAARLVDDACAAIVRNPYAWAMMMPRAIMTEYGAIPLRPFMPRFLVTDDDRYAASQLGIAL